MALQTLPQRTAVPAASARRIRVEPAWLLRSLLDLGLVLTLGASALYVVFGPIDAGLFTVSGVSKPLLQAMLLASLRVASPGASWLSSSATALSTPISRQIAVWSDASPLAAASTNAAVALISTQLVVTAVGLAAHVVYPEHLPRSFTMPFAALKLAETFAAWDSAWYVDIASRGYMFSADGQSNIAFFPLYPLLMRVVAWPFGATDRAMWISGIVVSTVCFFAALVLLHRLTEQITGDRRAARQAQLYLCVFPFAFPFTRVYSESLFLLVSVAATWYAVRDRWYLAGACGALTALTRPNGVLILVPLALLALKAWRQPATLARRLPALALVPAGLGVYCLFVFSVSGDPLAWMHAQAHWGYSIGHLPWALLQRTFETIEAGGIYAYLVSADWGVYALSHAVIGLLVALLTPSIVVRLGLPFGAYVAVSILVPLSGNALEGLGRYAATLFPVFIYLGVVVRTPRRHEALLIASALWLALNVGLFVTQRPVY